MGFVVDDSKCGGSGTSNDYNTTRRAFSNEGAFAKIAGINNEVIVKLHITQICG